MLNWRANKEADVAGYKLHYGTPTGYSYARTVDLGNVTSYTLTNSDISTEYAITAYDTSKDGTDDIVDGNESWYSVATKINVSPVLTDTTVSTDEDNSIDIKLKASDPDSSQITYALVSNASNGTVKISNNIATYTPSENFNGTDSFTVIANDGEASSNIATVSITINAVNDAPVAKGNLIIVNEGEIANVLENNETTLLHNDKDVENNSLTAILVVAPKYGTLTLNSDGTFSYEHNGSEITSDSFTYKANDSFLDSNIATVNIKVNPINDNIPTDIILSNSSIEENQSQISVGDFTAVDLDLPSDKHTFQLVDGIGADDNKNFTINGNNLVANITFDYENKQTLSIRVKVIDENNQFFEKSFTISIVNVNDIDLTYNLKDSYCTGNTGTGSISITDVNNTNGTVTYKWSASNGGIIPLGYGNRKDLKGLSSGTYIVSITDSNFTYNKSFEVSLIPQYNDLSICYVSSDSALKTKNRIYLNNKGNYNVAFYEILRETNITNVYTTIGTISPNQNSFLDETSNNESQSYNYKVRLIDRCGNTSSNSDLHKTILLQSSVATDNSVNLNWSEYEGAKYSTYNIYRNSNGSGAQLIGSVSSKNNSFNDVTANVSNNNYEYYVSVAVKACLKGNKSSQLNTSEIKSNFENIGSSLSSNDFISEKELSLYPNPAKSRLNIKLSNSIDLIKGEVYNTLGQKVILIKNLSFSIEKLKPSTYFIKIFTSKGITTRMFIKK